MTTLKNYTPVAVSLLHEEKRHYFPSVGLARVSETQENIGSVGNGYPLRRTTYGEITGLPVEEDGVMLIVSFMVRQANDASPNPRKDLISPDTGKSCIRDSNGQIEAVTGFCG